MTMLAPYHLRVAKLLVCVAYEKPEQVESLEPSLECLDEQGIDELSL